MINRIVKLYIKNGYEQDFRALFEQSRVTIAAFPGCHSLSLFTDSMDSSIFYTLSTWESEAHLNQYRSSAFFKETWEQVKLLFAQPPEAHTLVPSGHSE